MSENLLNYAKDSNVHDAKLSFQQIDGPALPFEDNQFLIFNLFPTFILNFAISKEFWNPIDLKSTSFL